MPRAIDGVTPKSTTKSISVSPRSGTPLCDQGAKTPVKLATTHEDESKPIGQGLEGHLSILDGSENLGKSPSMFSSPEPAREMTVKVW